MLSDNGRLESVVASLRVAVKVAAASMVGVVAVVGTSGEVEHAAVNNSEKSRKDILMAARSILVLLLYIVCAILPR
jgi:hypothetical protein